MSLFIFTHAFFARFDVSLPDGNLIFDVKKVGYIPRSCFDNAMTRMLITSNRQVTLGDEKALQVTSARSPMVFVRS